MIEAGSLYGIVNPLVGASARDKLSVHEPSLWYYGIFRANMDGRIPPAPFSRGGEHSTLPLAQRNGGSLFAISGQGPHAWDVPCFCIPVFCGPDGLYIQIMSESGRIIEFARIYIDESVICRTKMKIAKSLGDLALYAFCFDGSDMHIGNREEIAALLTERISEIRSRSFLLLEVANFLGSESLKREAMVDIAQIITELNPDARLDWIEEDLDSHFSWASIPEGPFRFRVGDIDAIRELPAFCISKHPVTNDHYRLFLDSNSKHAPRGNREKRNYPRGKANHPVVDISRKDAESYCLWLSSMTGKSYRLPDEHEWEKAARGDNGQDYPWSGRNFDPSRCNSAESGFHDTTPVDFYDNGKSPYECYDMVGNVSEWTRTTEDGYAIIRGSSYKTSYDGTRRRESSDCHFRINLEPDYVSPVIGFRIVSYLQRDQSS